MRNICRNSGVSTESERSQPALRGTHRITGLAPVRIIYRNILQDCAILDHEEGGDNFLWSIVDPRFAAGSPLLPVSKKLGLNALCTSQARMRQRQECAKMGLVLFGEKRNVPKRV